MCNGPPKAGTHALMALLDTMGLKRCPGTILPTHIEGMSHMNMAVMQSIPDNSYCLAHMPAKYDLSGFRVLTIFRDPRNVLVSYCRHRLLDGFVYSIPQALEDFWGQPFVPLYRSYLGWRGRSVVMRYEDMPPSVIGDGRGIYQNHGKDWNTRTASPSSWQEHWDSKIETEWAAHGGPNLLADAGYD